jgi:beta-lysine 5,6-aminomutase alpha subunit
VLAETEATLARIEQIGLAAAIGAGIFADISRTPAGGKGLEGVLAKSAEYYNPFPALMLGGAHANE